MLLLMLLQPSSNIGHSEGLDLPSCLFGVSTLLRGIIVATTAAAGNTAPVSLLSPALLAKAVASTAANAAANAVMPQLTLQRCQCAAWQCVELPVNCLLCMTVSRDS